MNYSHLLLIGISITIASPLTFLSCDQPKQRQKLSSIDLFQAVANQNTEKIKRAVADGVDINAN